MRKGKQGLALALTAVFLIAGLAGTPMISRAMTLEWRQEEEGKMYWYEDGVRQGTYDDAKGVMGDGTIRGREIYDPVSNGWYWLDSVYNGAKAVGKEVWIPYVYQEEDRWTDAQKAALAYESDEGLGALVLETMRTKRGKWVRYDENGAMLKGWVTIAGELAQHYPDQAGNTYYYDNRTGLMAKGAVTIDGEECVFDETTGVLISRGSAAGGELVYNAPTVHSTYIAKPYALQDDADFFVAVNGNDSNSGTKNAPFATFQRAKEAALAKRSSGDVKVAFMAGNYGNQTVSFGYSSPSQSNVITFCAYGNGEVVFSGAPGAVISTQDASYLSFIGFTFRDMTTAISIRGGRHITVQESDFSGSRSAGSYPVDVFLSDNVTVSDCEFHDLQGGAVRIHGGGNYEMLEPSHNLVDNNLIYDYCKGTLDWETTAIYLGPNCVGTRVSHNEIRDAQWGAIRFRGVDNIVEYNLIENIRYGREDFGVIYTGRSLVDRGNEIRYNMISNCEMGIAGEEIYAIYIDDGIAGQKIYGNLLYNFSNCSVLINGGRDNKVYDNVSITANGFHRIGVAANAKYLDNDPNSMGSWPGLRDSLNQLPAKGTAGYEVWRSRFPEIFSINMDLSATGDPQCVRNPSGTSLTNNYCFGTCGVELMGSSGGFVTADNNHSYDLGENPFFVNPTAGNYMQKSGAPFHIPVSQIGRY